MFFKCFIVWHCLRDNAASCENNHYIAGMSERKAWSEMEDSILKDLYENKQVKRWSQIARIMECQFHIRGRNGKQCRQRYHNHLDDSIRHDKWTTEEERALTTHHDQLGNRWAELSRFLPGRSENDIKNQFYSILRRGLRQINSIIRRQLKRYKELEVDTLYRITEEGGKGRGRATKDGSDGELKRIVMHYSFKNNDPNQQDVTNIKRFIEQVKNIGKGKYKKQNKKIKDIPQAEEVKFKIEDEDGKVKQKEREKQIQKTQEKVKEKQGQSQEEVDPQELRDNFLVTDVKKEPQRFRRNSFFNFTLEQPQIQMQLRAERTVPYKLRKRSSFYSNHSFDLSSPRWNELEPGFKPFQMQQTDNFSPKPQFYATSPYFDQSKSNLWHNHEFQFH